MSLTLSLVGLPPSGLLVNYPSLPDFAPYVIIAPVDPPWLTYVDV